MLFRQSLGKPLRIAQSLGKIGSVQGGQVVGHFLQSICRFFGTISSLFRLAVLQVCQAVANGLGRVLHAVPSNVARVGRFTQLLAQRRSRCGGLLLLLR